MLLAHRGTNISERLERVPRTRRCDPCDPTRLLLLSGRSRCLGKIAVILKTSTHQWPVSEALARRIGFPSLRQASGPTPGPQARPAARNDRLRFYRPQVRHAPLDPIRCRSEE